MHAPHRPTFGANFIDSFLQMRQQRFRASVRRARGDSQCLESGPGLLSSPWSRRGSGRGRHSSHRCPLNSELTEKYTKKSGDSASFVPGEKRHAVPGRPSMPCRPPAGQHGLRSGVGTLCVQGHPSSQSTRAQDLSQTDQPVRALLSSGTSGRGRVVGIQECGSNSSSSWK